MILKSSRGLHKSMLKSIMHSNMQFFESTPIGRILNRFSKDMSSVEFILPTAFKDVVFCAFDILTVLITISITTPLFTIILIPIGLFYFFIQVSIEFIKPLNQYNDLEIK
jgi:ATP-binding cassette subfamily C (CFTR/MRP) protein 2